MYIYRVYGIRHMDRSYIYSNPSHDVLKITSLFNIHVFAQNTLEYYNIMWRPLAPPEVQAAAHHRVRVELVAPPPPPKFSLKVGAQYL
jgi:hypothetical protein